MEKSTSLNIEELQSFSKILEKVASENGIKNVEEIALDVTASSATVRFKQAIGENLPLPTPEEDAELQSREEGYGLPRFDALKSEGEGRLSARVDIAIDEGISQVNETKNKVNLIVGQLQAGAPVEAIIEYLTELGSQLDVISDVLENKAKSGLEALFQQSILHEE